MFRKYFLSLLLFLSISCFPSVQLYAQEKEGGIIIGKHVHKEIDKKEGEKLELFPNIKRFQWDTFNEVQARKPLYQQTAKEDSTKKKKVDFTIRFGQGGFWNDRSPSGKFAGDQGALDIKLAKLPVAVSYLTEVLYGVNDNPDEPEEVVNLWAVNIYHMPKLFTVEKNGWSLLERINLFWGGGIGRLGVDTEFPDDSEVKGPRCTLFNFEAGINVVFWKIGIYYLGKYWYAQKKQDNIKVIDFKERGFFFGLTFNFGF